MKQRKWRFLNGIVIVLACVLVLVGCPEAGLTVDDSDDGGDDPVAAAPVTPENLAVSTKTDVSVTLTWDTVAEASEYVLVRDTVSDGSFSTTVYTGPDTSRTDTGLTAETTYYYRVKATNTVGESALSGPLEVTTTPTPASAPATPTGLQADSTSDASVVLSWDTVAEASEYVLVRDTVSDGSFSTTVYTGPDTSRTDTGLTAETTYYYRVKATNTVGESALSGPLEVTTTPTPASAPATPTGLQADSTSDASVVLSWDTVADASEYVLVRDTVSDGSFSTTVYTGPDTSRTDTGLTAETTYYYRVKATNTVGESALSGPLEVTTTPTPASAPATPTGLQADSTSDASVVLSWDTVADASEYVLVRDTVSDGSFSTTVYTGPDTSRTDTGLTAETTYYYRVKATNTVGESALSGPLEVTTTPTPASAPATPTGLQADSTSDASVVLSWDTVADASEYVLVRDTVSDGSFSTTVYTGPDTSGTDNTVNAQTTYYYRVKATNSGGESDLSDALTVRTPSAPITIPAIPAGFQIDWTTESSVVFSWSESAGATSYRIYRGDTEPVGLTSPIYNGGETTWSDTGLISDTTYYYALVAVNSAGSSGASTLSVTTQLPSATAPAAAPANLAVSTVSTSELALSWDAVADAASYELSRATDSGMTDAVVIYTGALLSYSDTDLNATSDYFYTALARNAAGDGPTSPFASGTTVPAVPAGLTVAQSSGDATTELEVAWDALDATATAEALTYEVFFSDSATGAYASGYTGSEAFTTVTGLTPGTTYYFKVRALLGSLQSAQSSARTATTVATLTAPAGVTVDNPTASTLDVSWTGSPGADGYSVFRALSAGGPWTEVADVSTGTEHPDTGLTAGTLYYYRVKAYSASAGVSAASTVASETTNAPAPATPDGLTVAQVSSTKLSVSWDSTDGATAYVVTRNGSTLPDKLSNSFTDTGLSAATAYTYTVAARNGTGTSAPSLGVTNSTYPAPPTAPTNVTVSGATDSALTVSWDAVSGADAYKLYVSTDDTNFSYRTLLTATSETVTGLAAQTTYYFRLRATNTGGESAESSSGSGTTLSGLATPDWYNWGSTDSTITLSWYAVADATEYSLYRADSQFGPWDTIIHTGTETEYTDTGLSGRTAYSYRLTATDGTDVSSLSPTRTVWTDETPAVPPASPGWIGLQRATAATISLSWSNVSDETGYILYRSDDPTVDETDFVAYTGPATSFTDTGLTASTTYSYAVIAENAAGTSGFSPTVTATTYGVPNAPSLGATLVTDTAALVQWWAVDGAAGYELYKSTTEPVTASDTRLYPNSDLEYEDSGLTPGTTYYYAVRAVNEVGESSLTQTSVTTAAVPPTIAAPTLSIARAYDYRVELNWTTVVDVSEYIVYRSATPGDLGTPATELAVLDSWATGYNDQDIESAGQYYYAVRAVAVDVEGTLSNTVSAGSITVIIE